MLEVNSEIPVVFRYKGHVAHMGTGEVRTGFWWGGLMERDHLEDLGVDRRIILK
jgi:hypothetical protein